MLHRQAFLTVVGVLFFSSQVAFASAPDLRGQVNILESQITGSCDSTQPLAARVSKLEEVVHGQARTGSLLKRIKDLHESTGAAAAPPVVPGTATAGTEKEPSEQLKGRVEADIRLGIKHHAEGRADEAEQAFRRALLADPDNVDAHFNIGVLYEKGGHLTSALAHYQAAANTSPGDADLLNAINSVQRKLNTPCEEKASQTGAAGLFHAQTISAPLLQGQSQKNSNLIDLEFAAATRASEKDLARPAGSKRIHPVRQKVLYTAAVVGLAATANVPGGGVGNAILGTVRRSFSCPLCHWISRF